MSIPTLVAVGASAGGLEALNQLLGSVNGETGMAIVIVQHLSPDHESMMPALLARRTVLNVSAARDGTELEAETVYVIEPQTRLRIEGRTLHVDSVARADRVTHPIDEFFQSAAAYPGPKAAVVLSGTGSDGAMGIAAMKVAGGTVVVQEPSTASFNGMPNAALRTQLVDLTLPAGEILLEIIALHRAGANVYFELGDERGGMLLKQILTELNRLSGVDFKFYKPSTILRRIQRRMQRLNLSDPREYATTLRNDEDELSALYHDLLIGVTRFYRDPGAIMALSEVAIPRVVARAGTSPIRAWVAGCSTGEEAYTVTILIADALASAGLSNDFRVFATDIDDTALNAAKAGEFTAKSIDALPVRIQRKYFRQSGATFIVSKEIREHLLFSHHNLIDEPPFSRLNFISCRNLLIYLRSEVQERIMQTFSSALIDDGVLWLGSSETIGRAKSQFDTLDARWRIYRARRGRRRQLMGAPLRMSTLDRRPKAADLQRSQNLVRMLETSLLGYAPPTLIIDAAFHLVYRYGELSGILDVPQGRMTLDVREMLPKQLSAIVYTAFSRVRESKDDLHYRTLQLESGRQFDMRVRRIIGERDDEDMLVLIFENLVSGPVVAAEVVSTQMSGDLQVELVHARRELHETRSNLQATIEELETANEELQSTNEELIAANEELQSTNEELQSVNEELHTVNAEHQGKVTELINLTEKLDDVLGALEMGVVVLDHQLAVQHFNRAATRFISLLKQDVGRPLAHLTHQLVFDDLLDRCSAVLKTRATMSRRTQAEGRDVLVRIYARQARAEEPAGIVLTISDISALRTARQAASELRQAFDLMDRPAAIVDEHGQIQAFNEAFAARLQRDPRHLQSMKIFDVMHRADRDSIREALTAVRSGQPWAAFVQCSLPNGDVFWELLDLKHSVSPSGQTVTLVTTQPASQLLPFDPDAVLDGVRGVFWMWEPKTDRTTASRGLAALWGGSGMSFEEIYCVGDDLEQMFDALAKAQASGEPTLVECRVFIDEARIRTLQVQAIPVQVSAGEQVLVGLTTMIEERDARADEAPFLGR